MQGLGEAGTAREGRSKEHRRAGHGEGRRDKGLGAVEDDGLRSGRERAGQAGNPAPDGLQMARRRTWYKGLGAPVAPGTAKTDESGRWLVRGTGASAALCVRACGWRRRGNVMRERGEMLARVKGWGELGLGPWRSWAADGPREACWAKLSL